MRKIFLTLLICLLIISCSSNEENTNEENAVEVSVPENLVGSWKFVGIYNYFDIDQVGEPYIENYDNGNILTLLILVKSIIMVLIKFMPILF
jgi:hypothetical protein